MLRLLLALSSRTAKATATTKSNPQIRRDGQGHSISATATTKSNPQIRRDGQGHSISEILHELRKVAITSGWLTNQPEEDCLAANEPL
jgi:hypothetical protein